MGEPVKSSLGVELTVTDDGWFEVVVDGERTVRTRVEASALAEFAFEVEQRSEPMRKRLAAERARGDIKSLQAEFFAGRAKAAGRGGRGGRGGV